MQVGDLVKLTNNPGQPFDSATARAKDFERVGLLTEFTCHGANGPLASGWVQWAGNIDWDCEFTEDLEVINASR